jgi:hypothetical protein
MATLGTVDIGDRPVITATFTSVDNVATDPTTVTFKHKVPSGTETSYVYGIAAEVSRTATGVFTFTVPTITASGRHFVRSVGTGAIATAGESDFSVRITAFVTP